MIETAEPNLNNRSGCFGKGTTFYRQRRDERLGQTRDEMLADLHEALQKR